MNSQNSSIIQSANAMVLDYCKRAIGIPISHVLVSRIYEKNLVYKITISDGAVYSVKLFLNRNNPSQRYNLENEILNIQKNCRFHTFRTKDILFSHVLNDNEFYAERKRYSAKHEQQGKLFGQCCDGELLWLAEK